MDVAGGDGRVAERHGDLVQIGDDVADTVEAADRGALMVVDLAIAFANMLGPQRHRELRTHLGPHHRIDHVELHRPAIGEDGPDTPAPPPPTLWLRGISAARLAPVSTTQTLRRKRAR
jgi:hypothetical protein